MDPLSAPSNPIAHGEHPPHSSVEGEENTEKKPVLKKVKDKVKKIKSSIVKKAHGHGGSGGGAAAGGNEDDNQHQQRDLDEGDEGYEEDEEIDTDPAFHGAPIYESSKAEARIGDMGIGRGGNDGVYGSSTVGQRTGVDEIGRGGGTQGDYGSSTAGINEIGGRGTGGGYGDSAIGGDSVGLRARTSEFAEDPLAPNSTTKSDNIIGETVDISPEIHHSLDAMATSDQNDGGKTELFKDINRGNAATISSTNAISGEEGAISPELHRSFNAMSVSDESNSGETGVPQNTNSTYTDKLTAAKDAAVSVASESAVLGKKVATLVYEKASEAGTAVMAKVMPDSGKDAEKPVEVVRDVGDEVTAKQDKGVTVRDYVTGKLSPGEEDKALSEVITEALTPGRGGGGLRDASLPTNSPGNFGGNDGGSGLGVVGRIKETVTSFLGAGGSPRGSPTDESKDFLGKTPEAVSHEKTV